MELIRKNRYDSDLTDDELDAIATLLKEYEPCLQKIEQLADTQFDRIYNKDAHECLWPIEQACRWQCILARYHLQTGNHEHGLNYLLNAVKLGRLGRSEGHILAQIKRSVVVASTLKQLSYLQRRFGFSLHEWRAISEELHNPALAVDLMETYKSKIGWDVGITLQPKLFYEGSYEPTSVFDYFPAVIDPNFGDLYQLTFECAKFDLNAQKHSRNPYWNLPADLRTTEPDEGSYLASHRNRSRFYLALAADRNGLLASARVYTHVQIFKLERGRWPATLDEVTPPFEETETIDTLTGERFELVPFGHGIMLSAKRDERKISPWYADGKPAYWRKILTDEDINAQLAAVVQLRKCLDPDRMLMEYLASHHPEVRLAALQAVYNLGRRRKIPAQYNLKNDPDPRVAELARSLLR